MKKLVALATGFAVLMLVQAPLVPASYAQGKMEMKDGMKDDKMMMQKEGATRKAKPAKKTAKKDPMMKDGMRK